MVLAVMVVAVVVRAAQMVMFLTVLAEHTVVVELIVVLGATG